MGESTGGGRARRRRSRRAPLAPYRHRLRLRRMSAEPLATETWHGGPPVTQDGGRRSAGGVRSAMDQRTVPARRRPERWAHPGVSRAKRHLRQRSGRPAPRIAAVDVRSTSPLCDEPPPADPVRDRRGAGTLRGPNDKRTAASGREQERDPLGSGRSRVLRVRRRSHRRSSLRGGSGCSFGPAAAQSSALGVRAVLLQVTRRARFSVQGA